MSNPVTSRRPPPGSILAVLAAVLCAMPAGAQFVSTVNTGFSQPVAVAVDASDNAYIADTGNYRIAKLVPSTDTLTTLAGSGSPGANSGTGTSASFFIPAGMVAARGGLIVADQGSQLIRYVTFGGTVTNLAGQAYNAGNINLQGTNALFSYPAGIAADSAGDIYVTEPQSGLIRVISYPANNVTTLPATNYAFNSPNAVAVDNNNNVWVTDSGNDVICMISNGAVTVVAGISGHPGTNDSLTAASAQFNHPSGLLWISASQSLLIADSGNDTLRSLFPTNGGYAVKTLAGLAGLPGFVSGTLAAAQFNTPVGLSVDPTDSGFYVADSGNNALRAFQATAPIPPPAAPVLGYVTFSTNSTGVVSSQFNPSSFEVFNSPADIAYTSDANSVTYITYGATGSSDVNGPSSPDPYGGPGQTTTVPSIVPTMPDITVTAYSVGPSGARSTNVVAEYKFITANPVIVGANGAEIVVQDSTPGAVIYYTLDGSIPSSSNSLPYTSGATLPPITVVSNLTLTVDAVAPNFSASGQAAEQLSVTNDIADQMTFGFAQGEASSEFIGAAGGRFLAPVTLSELSGGTTYSLQFSVTVTNGTGPALTNFTSRFDSMLKIGPPPLLATIEPGIVTDNGISTGVLTNVSQNLIEVAWIEIYPATNLYNTKIQDLTEFSQPHDDVFLEGSGDVVVGAFSFVIPTNAPAGSTYTIQLLRPSATTYDPPATAPIGVFMQAPTNGSLTNGAVNSIKTVTVGSSPYLVGDGYPFRWFNAGDFGDGVLNNDDVIEVFQSAVYSVNTPPAGSDYFNALDSSNGTDNDYYNGNDTTINSITMGDGVLAVDDVYVTLRRSLDPSLSWYDRYWSNGVRYAVQVPNAITTSAGSSPSSPAPTKTSLGGTRYVTVAADQVQTGGALTVQVPVRVLAADPTYPIRVTMLNVEVDPLDGSPPITNLISFEAVTNLGSPNTTGSQGANDFAAAWLNSTVSGVSGTNIIGTLTVTLPPNVTTNSAYLVRFDHFSASPNGLALFQATVQDGLITVGNRTGSSWHDGIPDTWRLLWFGTVSNALSAANADPDGDGASNWQEYIAGTDPLNASSVFKLAASSAPAGGWFTLQWPSVVKKAYTLQCAASAAGPWTTMTSNLTGNSQTLQWTDTNASVRARFYRASVQ